MSTYKEHLHLGDKDVLVETDDLASGAVTTPKLADGSVTAEKMEASLYERLNDHRTTTDKVTDALGRTQTQINQQLTDAINNWIFAEGTPPAAKTLQAATGDEYMVVNTAEGLRYLKLSDFIKAISDEFIDALDHLDEQGGETDPWADYHYKGEARSVYNGGITSPSGFDSGDIILHNDSTTIDYWTLQVFQGDQKDFVAHNDSEVNDVYKVGNVYYTRLDTDNKVKWAVLEGYTPPTV